MAIRRSAPTGPVGLPDLLEIVKARMVEIEGDAAMCPHCLTYCPKIDARRRSKICDHCKQTFFVRKLDRFTFVTSKRVIVHEES